MSKIWNQIVTHYIPFADSVVKTNQQVVLVQDILDTLADEIVDIGFKSSNLTDHIQFFHFFHVSGVVWPIHITQHLDFINVVTRTSDISLIDHLYFTQDTKFPIVDFIDFLETVIAYTATPIFDIIDFVDTFAIQKSKSVTYIEHIKLRDFAYAYKIPKKGKPYELIYTDPVTIIRTKTFTLSKDGKSVTLRPPIFGNTYKIQFNHIQQETRGKALILAGNNTYEYLKYYNGISVSFEFLRHQQCLDLLAFLESTIGQIITITTHEDIVYQGFLPNPEIEFSETARNNFQLNFDFEIVVNP